MLGGASLALLFWWHSLTPTLIPRSWQMQVGIGAVCLAIGYGIGALAEHWGQRLRVRSNRSSGEAMCRRGWIILRAAWLVGILVGATLWRAWQNEQRNFMGMASIGGLDSVLVGALSPLAGVLLVVVGRMISTGVAAIHRFIQRHVPAAVSVPATAVLLVALGIVLGRGVALRALTAVVESIYAPANEETSEGIVIPDSAFVSGSSTSLIPWEALGRRGRDFVATATTAEQLMMIERADANLADPVRVYVGVRSADSTTERASLAVRELERAGGFDRKVLVVWVPTGTGWMIPKAAAALELLHRGDTAIVAIQYSFLPSLVAVFVHAGEANEAGIALFNAVHARWSELPQARRPKLLVFGKSLGAAGVEASFVGVDAASSVAHILARTDGALIAGAARSNTIHRQLTHQRDAGSPVWRPVFDGGRFVRFFSSDPVQLALHSEWSSPRIVYLQHGSDPVAFWSVEALWWPPEWMARPRAFDVPERLSWFPIVSSVQSIGDFLNQLGPPAGFGHDYSTSYVEGWVSLIAPEGWAQADTERLEHYIDRIHGEESEP